jgi:hypothetical protein
MATQYYWIGSVGPFAYEDVDGVAPTYVNDENNHLGVATVAAPVVCTGQLTVQSAPTVTENVLRLDDFGGTVPGSNTPNLVGNSYTIVQTDYLVLIDDDDADVSGTVVVALPTVASSIRRTLFIKKIGTSYDVQLDGNGAETIDEQATVNISGQYDCVCVFCDGTEWWII